MLLKPGQETASIPVIVSTAKELTLEEKNRIKGTDPGLIAKGRLPQ